MPEAPDVKVTARHLCRTAYVYVRQAALGLPGESAKALERQYSLEERLVSLGWPPERVVVVDSDLGRSGFSATKREGFRLLLEEVGKGTVGAVAALDMSRLARDPEDIRRLLSLCGTTDTLLLDEEGVCDLQSRPDRLVLGLSGRRRALRKAVRRRRVEADPREGEPTDAGRPRAGAGR
jgi:DNA invertase Pin-like site-specific DNA recombinase